jgi:UDPglucose 6-dehydrogenase
MKIGIIGMGVVGNAMEHGFLNQGFEVLTHDIKHDTTIESLLQTEIVYISVPSPALDNGQCDTSIIENCVVELSDLNYTGVIAIKSTIPPGTTQSFIDKYKNTNIAFVPEFMKERCAAYDFEFNNEVLIIGAVDIHVSDIIIRSHGKISKKFLRLNPTEAETIKYMHNSFGAMRVIFGNLFYDIAQQFEDVDYDKIKNGFVTRNGLPDEYLDVSEHSRGYAGACFPKDMRALEFLSSDLNYEFISAIINDNDKLTKTTFPGMRHE